MLFFANFDPPSPCHTLSHIPGPPESTAHISDPPRFLVGLVEITRTKATCTNSLSIVHGTFCSAGFCQRVFCLEGFVRGWLLSVPPPVRIHLLQQKVNITLNFMFHVYDKIFYKRDVTCS